MPTHRLKKASMSSILSSKRASREMSPVIATFEPGGELEMSSHEGEEFLHVLEGRFSLTLGNDQPADPQRRRQCPFSGGKPALL